MTLFKNKYRVESARKEGKDYRDNGWYFITVVTKNREPFFGHVENDQTILSHMGHIISNEWTRISCRPWVYMDEWVIMPNHIHGIIRIDRPVKRKRHNAPNVGDDIVAGVRVETPHDPPAFAEHITSNDPIASWGVSTITTEPPHLKQSPPLQSSRLYANSIGSIINQFKSACTKRIWAAGYRHFAWQPRFHDHIIRDERALENIRNYIRMNPANWNH
jgi:REP element-mobilizing transposase RayT